LDLLSPPPVTSRHVWSRSTSLALLKVTCQNCYPYLIYRFQLLVLIDSLVFIEPADAGDGICKPGFAAERHDDNSTPPPAVPIKRCQRA
jgi:hypothetical protein